MTEPPKYSVYLLASERNQLRYVGITDNVNRRLEVHNSGGSSFTAPHRPWRLVVAVEFPTELRARQFERYLKTGSGRAFAKRHFV
jgi:predicted GIY-YIG superfamily endonuclease